MARHLHRLTGEQNLCMAGGVAYNCVANSRIRRELDYRQVFFQPAAGGAGTALGAALWLTNRRGGVPPRGVIRDVFPGPPVTQAGFRASLGRSRLYYYARADEGF